MTGGKLSILFWNIQKKNVSEVLSRLLKVHDIDIMVLAELTQSPEFVRREVAAFLGQAIFYKNRVGLPSKTHLFTVRNSSFVSHVYTNTNKRLSVFNASYPLFPRFLIGTIHGASKKNYTEESLAEEARLTMSEARLECIRLETMELLLCGDFNLNPFDKGMMMAGGYHAVMDRATASRTTKIIQARAYPMMYSPMWSLMGDWPGGPPGTLHYNPGLHEVPEWHMVDQFLLSPQLLKSCDIEEIEIVSDDGRSSFLNDSGQILGGQLPDHLPIRVKLVSK